jgi:hypothetical protein
MRSGNGHSRGLRALLAVGVSLAALAVSVGSLGGTSEIEAYKAAIKSQSEADALHFIRNFGSSDLVDDLVRSLRSDVALQACIALRGGRTAEVRDACQAFPTSATVATAPDLFLIAPAAGAGSSPSGPPINRSQGGHDNGGNIILRPIPMTATPSAPTSGTAPAEAATESDDSSSSGGGAVGGDSSNSGASSGGSAASSDGSGSGDSSSDGDSGVSAGVSGGGDSSGGSVSAGVSAGGISGGVSAGVGGGGVSAGGGVSVGD